MMVAILDLKLSSQTKSLIRLLRSLVTNVDSNRSIVLDFFDTYVTLFSHGGGNLGFQIYTKFLKWEKVTVFHIGTNLTKDHSLIVYNGF